MRFKKLISIFLLCSLWTASISTPSYAGQIFDPTGGKDNPVFTGVSSFPNGTQAAPSGIFTGITDRGFFNDTTNNRFGIAEGLSLPGGQLVLTALSTPGTPTVTPRGTTGATSYGYKITATNGSGVTVAGAEGTTATGNATLSSTNYNELSWTAVTGATGYKVYRTTGGATQGLISTITSGSTVTVNDTGLAGGGETPETANTTGQITLPAGGGTATYTPSGALNINITAAGNPANTNETNLITYTMPANTFNTNGYAVRIKAWGTFAATANNKVVKLYFGSQIDNMSTGQNGSGWVIDAIVVRTGASTQDAFSLLIRNGVSSAPTLTTLAETDTAAITIKVTGQSNVAGAANDVVAEGLIIEFLK